MAQRKSASLKKSIRKTLTVKSGSLATSVNPWLLGGFGLLFGYFLSKSQATDFDAMQDMLRFKSVQLWGVIGMAIFIVALGLLILQWINKPSLSGKPLDWEPLKFHPNRILGALVFGVGWALSGACPGTALTQIGEGKLMAIATVGGILAGVWLYGKFPRVSESDEQVC
jgi:uncharacterized membrane protein YedE/YeeE